MSKIKKGTLDEQVRKVLEADTQSRNSDIRLTQLVWWQYYRDLLFVHNGQTYASLNTLFELPREDAITRVRRKVQNDEKLFVPTDPDVAKKRGWETEEWLEYLRG